GEENEDGWFVLPTTNHGCIVTGYTESYGAGESDVWLIKIDENGNEQWNKTYGGKGWDEGLSMETTNDGGYIITGSTTSYGAGESDVWLIKIDENGNEQWNKTYGGKSDDEGRSVVKTYDGGYALAGGTSSYGNGGEDFWLVKVDENGEEEWNSTFGSENEEYCNQIIQTSDNGFLLAGH
ncbi:MAG: hypothetical protein DRN01_05545, partial [Thermoplasmata archaeon]